MHNNDQTPAGVDIPASAAQSSTARERILARIRTSRASTGAMLTAEAARMDHTPPAHVHPPADDLAEQFATELTRLEGQVYRCAKDKDALEIVRGILQEHQANAVITWELDQIGLAGLDTLLTTLGIRVADSQIAHVGSARKERLQELDPIPVCISGVACAIAESGSLVVLSGAGRGRLASLLAPIHIAVVRTTQIYRGLSEALAAVQQQHGPHLFDKHSNLTLITGPSRTADIELTLTLGVHGPREVHVILIDAALKPKAKQRRTRGRRVNYE